MLPRDVQTNWRQTALHRLRQRALSLPLPPHLPSTRASSASSAGGHLSAKVGITTGSWPPSAPKAHDFPAQPASSLLASTLIAAECGRPPAPDECAVSAAGLPVAPVEGFSSNVLYRRWLRSRMDVSGFVPQPPLPAPSAVLPPTILQHHNQIAAGALLAEAASGVQSHTQHHEGGLLHHLAVPRIQVAVPRIQEAQEFGAGFAGGYPSGVQMSHEGGAGGAEGQSSGGLAGGGLGASGGGMGPEEFSRRFDVPCMPVILTGAMGHWAPGESATYDRSKRP